MTAEQQCSWMGHENVPDEYRACICAALRRLVIVLNIQRGSPWRASWLVRDDAWIHAKFRAEGLEPLVVFLEERVASASGSDLPTSLDEAENNFYSRFAFNVPRGVAASGSRVTFRSTPAFLKWSYDGLFSPLGDSAVLERKKFVSTDAFMADCATNYLLKNFWHNYVHKALQGIDELNFSKFRHESRYESDFEADNLATMLLVRSYGYPLLYNGRGAGGSRDRIRSVFARNRCNRVFVERETIRRSRPDGADVGSYEDAEWYFRRRVANQLSARLVEDGHAATRLSVHLSGDVKQGRRGPYRDGFVSVHLNGVAIDTSLAPSILDPLDSNVSAVRRANQRRRIDDIVAVAASKFGSQIRSSEVLRKHAEACLASLSARMGNVALS